MGIRRVPLPLHDPSPPAAPSHRDRTPRPGQALPAPVRQLIEFLYDTLLCRRRFSDLVATDEARQTPAPRRAPLTKGGRRCPTTWPTPPRPSWPPASDAVISPPS